MLRHAFIAIAAVVAITVPASLTGCKDPLHNYEECVDIETARCDLRDACIGDAAFDREFPDFDRDTCVAYAKEHCRTRKIGASDFSQSQVKACVEAIANQPCDSLVMNEAETRSIEECEFLMPEGSEATETESETQSETESETPTQGASDAETATSSQTESADTAQAETAS